MFRLERTLLRHAEVLGLRGRQHTRQLGADLGEMERRTPLCRVLRQRVDLVLVLGMGVPQLDPGPASGSRTSRTSRRTGGPSHCRGSRGGPATAGMMRLPSGTRPSSTCGFTCVPLEVSSAPRPVSPSRSCPMLQTMARCFIARIVVERDDSRLPVAVTKMSARGAASPSSRPHNLPSPPAGRKSGRSPVTSTRQPACRSEAAEPLPTSP